MLGTLGLIEFGLLNFWGLIFGGFVWLLESDIWVVLISGGEGEDEKEDEEGGEEGEESTFGLVIFVERGR